jgi:p-aminobenzoyl-glutamate transporter AbgT
MFLLIIGVVLVIVGALIYRELGPEPIVRLAAALLALGGIVCIILGILDLAGSSDTAQASYGKGAAHQIADVQSYGKG